jgi:hypothetical protein
MSRTGVISTLLLLTLGPIVGYVLYAKLTGPLDGKAVFALGFPLFIITGFFAGLLGAKLAKDEWNWGVAYVAFFVIWGCFYLAPVSVRMLGLVR